MKKAGVIMSEEYKNRSKKNRNQLPNTPESLIRDYQNTLQNSINRQNQSKNTSEQAKVIRIPKDFKTITDAVFAATTGDTILVNNGVYKESVMIPMSKSSIRIIAMGKSVVLQGNANLEVGFNIMADNTEIQGFSIRNFVRAGIRIHESFGCKLIRNMISDVMVGNGIESNAGTFSTLIWKNRLEKCRMDGIDLRGKNNWIVENEFIKNGVRGIHVRSIGNHIIKNRIFNNGTDGLTDAAGYNLIYNNQLIGNGHNGILEQRGVGGASILQNVISKNGRNGISLNTGMNNVFSNKVEENDQSGTKIGSDFNQIVNNKIDDNHDNGILLSERATNNLVYKNKVTDNITFDINQLNPRNMIFDNQCMNSNPIGICDDYPWKEEWKRANYSPFIIRVPEDVPTIVAAVDKASSGTTIFVNNGVYEEEVTIPLSKSSIRLIAIGKNVILDGKNRLKKAFSTNSNNIEINGFKIRNYVGVGCFIQGIGTKILNNTIHNIKDGSGIQLNLAFSTLIWNNRIMNARKDGISITAMNTWIIENEITENGENGITPQQATTVGGTFTKNLIGSNGIDGIADHAGFNFMFQNKLTRNKENGIHELSGAGYAAIIEDEIYRNYGNGINLETSGSMVSNSKIRNNKESGIIVKGNNNVNLNNHIIDNSLNGINLLENAEGNLIFGNKLRLNRPFDVNSSNPNNIFIDNQCDRSNPPGIC